VTNKSELIFYLGLGFCASLFCPLAHKVTFCSIFKMPLLQLVEISLDND